MYNVFMAIPAFGDIVQRNTFLTSHALSQAFAQKGIGFGVSMFSFPDIAELRGIFTTIWYDVVKQSNHLLFVDSDMSFPPELVLDMLMFDEPLVGSLYPQRRLPMTWAGSGTGEGMAERRGNFMRVEGVGMGCTMIRRDLITAMIERMPDLVDETINMHPAKDLLTMAGANRLFRFFEKLVIPGRGTVSEDLSFCIRAGQLGVPTWAAIGHRMSHTGFYSYEGCYLEEVNKAQQVAQAVEAQQPSAPILPNTVVQLQAAE